MARYTGPSCKLCRRENMKLYLKGDRCYKEKCSLETKPYAPGQHGKQQKKISDYGLQLREKQKVKRLYGIFETQFRRYFENATRAEGITGEILLQILERRLDNVVYRAGFAGSRKEARQVVRHNHIKVNGKKVDIPSYLCKIGDIITIKKKSLDNNVFEMILENSGGRPVPQWLELDRGACEVKIIAMPERDQIEAPVEEHLIVEFYSK